MVLYICEKFHNNISNVFNLQSGHAYIVEMAIFNVQRAATPKVGKPELQFICVARCLIVLYSCVKFRENISDGIRVMERTRMVTAGRTDVLTDGHLLGTHC